MQVVTLSGVTPLPKKDGSIDLLDEGGVVVSHFPAGLRWDSNPDIPEEQRRVPVATGLVGKAGAWVLEVRPDWAWLSNPKTVFPVTIDPTIYSTVGTVGDAYVVNNVPNGGYDGAAQWSSTFGIYITRSGYSKPTAGSPWNEYRSFYQFARPGSGGARRARANSLLLIWRCARPRCGRTGRPPVSSVRFRRRRQCGRALDSRRTRCSARRRA